jgi:hypothetical protein
MEDLIQKLEQRIIDLERRFYPIENIMYEQYEKEIELRKSTLINQEGYSYKVQYTLETDKGKKDMIVEVKAYTEKQALFISNRDIVYPNMCRLKDSGKIKWFKTINKQIVK